MLKAVFIDFYGTLVHEDGYTVIVITHNPHVAEETDHVFRMKDGELALER